MRHIVISGLPAGTVFFTASNKRHDFREKVTEYEMCGLIFFYNCCLKLILSRTGRDIIKNVYRASCKVPFILVGF